MKKIAMCLIILILLQGLSISAFAEDGDSYVSGIYTYTISGQTATITDCDKSVSGDIVVPAQLDGYAVTTIGDDAFWGCKYITGVSLPEGLLVIGYEAFYDCFLLERVSVPSSVTLIEAKAFYNCTNLTDITVPSGVDNIGVGAFSDCKNLSGIYVDAGNQKYESVGGVLFDKGLSTLICYPQKRVGTAYFIPSGVSTIAQMAFYNCGELKSIFIPSGVKEIGVLAFFSCTSLEEIEIPQGVTWMGERAFANCVSLAEVTMPDSVDAINDMTFANCTTLKTTKIPRGVASIGDAVFLGCTALAQIDVDPQNESFLGVEGVLFNRDGSVLICYPSGKNDSSYFIPKGVKTVGVKAFLNSENLRSVTIPKGVKEIGREAFSTCRSLLEINLPEGTEAVGSGAFMYCSRLREVNIPASVSLIDKTAFLNCKNLSSINVDGQNMVYSSDDGVLFDKAGASLICYPSGKSRSVYTIPNGVTSIGDHAFSYSERLRSVVVPQGVESIGEGAFLGCSSLENMTIPKSVTSVGAQAFSECKNLLSVKIPDNVTSIGSSAFSSCPQLIIYCNQGSYAEVYAIQNNNILALDNIIQINQIGRQKNTIFACALMWFVGVAAIIVFKRQEKRARK